MWSWIVGVGWLVLGGMICMLDFVGLIVNLFAFNHLVGFERLIFIFDFKPLSQLVHDHFKTLCDPVL